MDNQAQRLQAAAALLRQPSALQQHLRRERGEPESGTARHPRALVSPAQHKPVLETDEFRVVEPDGSEDPGASADDGMAPERPAADSERRRGKD